MQRGSQPAKQHSKQVRDASEQTSKHTQSSDAFKFGESQGAHGVVVSHPLRMRKALGSNPSVSICFFLLSPCAQRAGDVTSIEEVHDLSASGPTSFDKKGSSRTKLQGEPSCQDSLPEWSKGVDSSSTSASCVGSNPTAVNFDLSVAW